MPVRGWRQRSFSLPPTWWTLRGWAAPADVSGTVHLSRRNRRHLMHATVSQRRTLLWLVGALLLPVPWLALRLSGRDPGAGAVTLLAGLAILGAAFLLSWAAEVSQLDISQAL